MNESAWLIPIFPLLSFALILFIQKRAGKGAAYIGITAAALSLLCSIGVIANQSNEESVRHVWKWLTIGDMHVTMGYELTSLNCLMLVLVSGISLMVQIYSIGYMEKDERFPIFYGYLGFFTFAMLGLVLSPNLLQLYVFWELVGLGSFLLIGFYFYKIEAKQAAKKAFIMTRIGDVGLLIGMILLFWKTGSFDFQDIFHAVSAGNMSSRMITLTAILIFVGAVGKSGQFPLHSWLPDAMEGPTPVSALIHAATMVAAGVYLVALMFPLFAASQAALLTVSITGAFTAIFAAFIGLVQNDIKRVLAYSTVSQLGYMMLALGSSGYVAGIFHLTTHAFFKALLFLAAGSVIHASHTQDIREMGGLWKKLRWTGPLFLIGALALTGFPLFSGFFSKEAILGAAWASGQHALFYVGVFTAFLTSLYVFRLFFMVFFNGPSYVRSKVKESPAVMVVPMVVLAVGAIGLGWLETPWNHAFSEWLMPHIEPAESEGWITWMATIASLMGIFFAYFIFEKKTFSSYAWAKSMPFTYKWLLNKGYIDELYDWSILAFFRGLAKLFKAVDRWVVEGLANAISSSIYRLGKITTNAQTGQVQTYGFAAAAGLVLLMIIYAWTGGYIG
ncbi:NADH-quinone oxidoreductase subunit L [Falsibacillus albus]|uniref:NADH-quinone oxidoreductase subunit L n=1 Tax=Falsibacillus albus TaxID=2478915 RepID=A0A3L7JH05_9BACI|nr:NADH-quinone oxidoreductase subunit L [Falsibacillus albus]RLQ89963.1 NADH-quinone oxidoreductase subunit L [Falsibacillus albus]